MFLMDSSKLKAVDFGGNYFGIAKCFRILLYATAYPLLLGDKQSLEFVLTRLFIKYFAPHFHHKHSLKILFKSKHFSEKITFFGTNGHGQPRKSTS